MEKIGDVLNPKSDYAKLPYDETLITSVTTWGNVAIYALTIVATVMFMLDTTDCFYLGLMNGVVEIIGVAFIAHMNVSFNIIRAKIQCTSSSMRAGFFEGMAKPGRSALMAPFK